MEDRLLDPDGILFNLVPILVHEHDDVGEVACCIVVVLDVGEGILSIFGYIFCFLVDTGHPPGNHIYDSVELLPPFPAIGGDVGEGGLFAKEDEPGGPAVVEIEFRQCRRMPGVDIDGKPSMATNCMSLRSSWG